MKCLWVPRMLELDFRGVQSAALARPIPRYLRADGLQRERPSTWTRSTGPSPVSAMQAVH